jgi:hypothetical protein
MIMRIIDLQRPGSPLSCERHARNLITVNQLRALIPDLITGVAQGGSPIHKMKQSEQHFCGDETWLGGRASPLAHDSLSSNAARFDLTAANSILARASLLDALNLPANWPAF